MNDQIWGRPSRMFVVPEATASYQDPGSQEFTTMSQERERREEGTSLG